MDIVKLLCALSLQDKSATVRTDAVSALGHLCGKNRLYGNIAINSLTITAGDPSASVRQSTAFTLAFVDSPHTPPLLLNLLRDTSLNVINWAAFAINLLDYDSVEIRKALFKLLEIPNDDIQKEAIIGLAKRQDRRVMPFIKNTLEIAIREGLVYDDSIEAASLLGDVSLLPLLNTLLGQFEDDDGFIKKAINQLQSGQ